MKKSILGACLFSILLSGSAAVSSVSAGEYCTWEKGPKAAAKKLEKFDKKLSLSPEQKTQLKTILDEKVGSGKGKMSEEDCKDLDGKIKALLNDEQKTKYDQMMAGKEGKAKDKACCPH
jgi:hypothetical protein